jgi:hypothetical protein
MRARRRSIVRLLAAAPLVGVLALGGCGGEPAPASAPPTFEPTGQADDQDAGGEVVAGGAAACVAAVSYQGTLYIQVNADRVEQGEPIQGAETPPCDDMGGGAESADSPEPVEAFAVQGVDAKYAVMTVTAGGQFVFVAQEFAPGLVDAKPLPADVARALGTS